MTTQNMQSEHSDADKSVVEHSSSPGTNTVASSTGREGMPPSDTTEPTTPAVSLPTNEATPAREHAGKEQGGSDLARQDQQQTPHASARDGRQQAAESPDIRPATVEEEVRPFTDYIEEFRQAETRFNTSLHEYEATSLPSQASGTEVGAQAVTHPQQGQMSAGPAETSVHQPPTDDAKAQPLPSKQEEQEAPKPAERPVSPLLRPATRLRVPRQGAGRHQQAHAAQGKTTASKEEKEAEQKGEQRTSPTTPSTGAANAAPTPPIEPESPAQVEQPKPARRYRFDRPASPATPASMPTPPAPTRPDEHKETASRGIATSPVAQRPEPEPVQAAPGGQGVGAQFNASMPMQTPEQGASRPPAIVQESAAVTTVVPATPDRGRRQEKQREKEQHVQPPAVLAAPASAAVSKGSPVTTLETTLPTAVESAIPTSEEVHPEDLPPLEYSDLQKVNSRRRRRRHPGNGNAAVAAETTSPAAVVAEIAAKTVTPETPSVPVTIPSPTIPTPTPSIVMPRPATPAAPANPSATAPFAITSGFTLNQMNQGLESSGPFLGPEPSPARGSMTSTPHNVRPIRGEAQRSAGVGRSASELAPSSIHQLGSVITQAIQMQSDRLIAEMRRANQSPTNISVSLPPFPSTERVGIFVDVANLLYSARTLRMTVDFGKLLDFLRGNRRLVRAQAYCPTSPQPGDEQMFLQAVKGLGYRITTKNYKTFSSGAKKADLDLDLCMDVVRLVDGKAVDCVVLVSGDSDFMPMLDYCSDHGVRVEVAAFDEAMSATLRQSCDLFVNLSILEEIRA